MTDCKFIKLTLQVTVEIVECKRIKLSAKEAEKKYSHGKNDDGGR